MQDEERCPSGGGPRRAWRLDAPPLYTAGPNPWLGEVCRGGRAGDPTPAGEVERGRAASLLSGGKNDPLYMLHPYHTKVPHQPIAEMIERHTRPGEVVLDPFCGSGMTGVAARLTGRRAVLVDLSPAATFIAHGYLSPLPPPVLRRAGEAWLRAAQPYLSELYRTPGEGGGPLESAVELEYTVWSDRFQCPECGGSFLFWDAAVGCPPGAGGRRVLTRFPCPKCGRTLSKTALIRVWGPAGLAVQEPVERCLPGNHSQRHLPVTDADRVHLARLAAAAPPDGYPADPLPVGLSSNQPRLSHGLTRVDQFYTPRNLRALAHLWAGLDAFPPEEARALAFHWTAVARNASRMNRWPRQRGPLSGTLYLPSLSYEIHVGKALARHLRKGVAAAAFLRAHAPGDPREALRIGTQSATDLAGLPDASVDYVFTDPPFGDNLMYSELNLLWEAWLGVRTDPALEMVVDPVRGRNLATYQTLLAAAFREAHRVLKPGRAMTVVFHHARARVWQAVQEALAASGLELDEVQALDKRQGSFKQLTSAGAVRYDLVLTLRKPARRRRAVRAGTAKPQNEKSAEAWALQFLARVLGDAAGRPTSRRAEDDGQAGEGEGVVRDGRPDPAWLYSRYVAERVRLGLPVDLDAGRFYGLLRRIQPLPGAGALPT
ncbi:DNA methyltransferase [Limnochorda pilosa]|uniref:DNA methylase n=1 Tax=Limnochorda pilosa TaxID=1555112 RepID=A0A0K2SNR0_LIMPI|nr:DNA methyltransferase [Limnochorda pilosa]BAS28745.1 DNA methylase [Limnochorda pilosa]